MPDIIGRTQAVSLAGTIASGQTFSDRLQDLEDRFPTVEKGEVVMVATPDDIEASAAEILQKVADDHYLGMRATIATTEDFNSYRGPGTEGVYNIPYDATPANCPGETGWRTLFVYTQPGAATTRQILINFQSHEYHYRVFTSGRWYDWNVIGDRDARVKIEEILTTLGKLEGIVSGDSNELMRRYGTFNDSTQNSVSFHWVEPCTCVVSGTANSFVFKSVVDSTNAIPDWLERGKKYIIKVNSTSSKVLFQIFTYKNGAETGYRFFNDGEFTIPTDVTGIMFRIRSYFDSYPVTINDTITFGVYEATDEGLVDKVSKLEKISAENTTAIERLTIGDTNVIDLVNDPSTVTVANEGKTLNVLTYNVANYNNDTTTYLSNTQMCNFRKFLSTAKADVVCIQEHRNYIDSGNTKDAHNYLYRPVYPIRVGTDNSIFTKAQTSNGGTIAYSADSARNFSYCVMPVGTKKLLLVSTHLSTGNDATGQNKRRNEYDELLKWVHGEVTISSKQVPVWDYCVIAGDFNSAKDIDKQNLTELSTARGFTMANGGWLGWIQTNTWNTPIDSVMCSSNMIINSIDVYESWKTDLYSDHYPLVCNITLLDS